MAFALQITKKAREKLDNLPTLYRSRIIAILDDIVLDPFSGKKLTGKKAGQYSVRVWPYRIIYRIYKKELIVFIIDVGHRQGVYK
ncbi:type II toxin-antitoxin system RelE/ParE family toxin [Patescibacteria group bacterium]|nr:type II toxin-antitoxin system RelE/ParE family toxin [Patescibacteria group bacterium]